MKVLILSLFFITSTWAKQSYFQTLKEIAPKSCDLVKENIFLTDAQKKSIEKNSGVKLYGKLALRYKCILKDQTTYYYIDSHIVRTLNETVILGIKKDNLISYKVSSFNEPQEYIAPTRWLDQLTSKNLSKYKLRENIDGLSGATLTAKASVDTANKIIEMHKTLKRD